MHNDLRGRLQEAVAHRPPSTVDIDRAVAQGRRSLRWRRVAAACGTSVVVAAIAGAGTLLPGSETAVRQPPVINAPEQPVTKAAAPGKDFTVRLIAERRYYSPYFEDRKDPPDIIGTATVRCDGTTTTQVRFTLTDGYTWDGRPGTPSTERGWDANNRVVTMHSLITTYQHGNEQVRKEFICGGDIFPKPWGSFGRPHGLPQW